MSLAASLAPKRPKQTGPGIVPGSQRPSRGVNASAIDRAEQLPPSRPDLPASPAGRDGEADIDYDLSYHRSFSEVNAPGDALAPRRGPRNLPGWPLILAEAAPSHRTLGAPGRLHPLLTRCRSGPTRQPTPIRSMTTDEGSGTDWGETNVWKPPS